MTEIPKREVLITSVMVCKRNDTGVKQACMLMQDAFTELFYAYKCNGEPMQRQCGALWILTRSSYRLVRPPRWMERVIVRCWPVRIAICGVYVNLEITSLEGEPLLLARADLMLIDETTRRPRRLAGTLFPADMPTEPTVYPQRHEPWPEGDGAEVSGTFSVSVDDEDMNGHANNLAYVRWLLASGGDAAMDSRRFTLHYLRECRRGETLTGTRRTIPGGVAVELTADGVPAAQGIFFASADFDEESMI